MSTLPDWGDFYDEEKQEAYIVEIEMKFRIVLTQNTLIGAEGAKLIVNATDAFDEEVDDGMTRAWAQLGRVIEVKDIRRGIYGDLVRWQFADPENRLFQLEDISTQVAERGTLAIAWYRSDNTLNMPREDTHGRSEEG